MQKFYVRFIWAKQTVLSILACNIKSIIINIKIKSKLSCTKTICITRSCVYSFVNKFMLFQARQTIFKVKPSNYYVMVTEIITQIELYLHLRSEKNIGMVLSFYSNLLRLFKINRPRIWTQWFINHSKKHHYIKVKGPWTFKCIRIIQNVKNKLFVCFFS